MYIGRHILSGFLLLSPFQAMAQMNVVVEEGAVYNDSFGNSPFSLCANLM